MRRNLSALAFDKLQQKQEHDCSHEGTDEFANFSRRAQPKQLEKEAPEQCPDDAYDDVAEDAEAMTFDYNTRQKPGGQSDQDEPNPVFHMAG